MSEKKSRGSGRTRSWTFVLYPESAPKNWREVIEEEHIQWAVSPLHDKDFNADGEIKKPHWHVLLCFESVKTFEQIKELTDKLKAPIPQKCNGAKGLVRYFAHLDNPEKAQYDVKDIQAYGGLDVSELLKITSSERYSLIRDMITYIQDNNIMEFQDLMNIAMSEKYFDTWFPLLCDNSAYVVQQYIKSQRHRKREVDS